MHKLLIITLLLSASCSQLKLKQRTLASVDTDKGHYPEEGVLLSGLQEFYDTNSDGHVITMKNLKSFELKYKINASESLSLGSKTTCGAEDESYSGSLKKKNDTCKIHILPSEDSSNTESVDLTIEILGKYEITEYFQFKNYSASFCVSINRIIDTYFQEQSGNSDTLAWERYKYKDEQQRETTTNYKRDCKQVQEHMDDSFDIKTIYSFCQRDKRFGKEKYMNQLTDFDMATTCDDANY